MIIRSRGKASVYTYIVFTIQFWREQAFLDLMIRSRGKASVYT
jgi:hypothetical protein